jgi:hypothetical protein
MREAVTITVSPVGYSTRGRLFDARLDGRLIVARSPIPLCDACRLLLAEAIATPETRVAMRYAGSDHDALRSTVGKAAGLAVADNNAGKPIFRKWQPSPYDSEKAIPVSSPIRQTEEDATKVAPLAEAA